MQTKKKERKHMKTNKGTTLVELLVAGVILLLIIITFSIFVGITSGLNRSSMLNRRAFQELERVLESTDLSYHNYDNLYYAAEKGYTWPDDGNLINHESNPVLFKSPDITITGDLSVLITRETFKFDTENVPGLRILACIVWDKNKKAQYDTLSTVLTAVKIH